MKRPPRGANSPWLRTLRAEAFARFCETGFPTTHDEDWRFTNVSAIARAQFAREGKPASVNASELRSGAWKRAAAELVFVDGQFVRELSVMGNAG